MEANFTKGPWQVGFKDGSGIAEEEWERTKIVTARLVPENDDLPQLIACAEPDMSSDGGVKEVNANAHLIAAAPDMYEALEQLVDDSECYCSDQRPEFACGFCMGRQALAKARG